MFFAGEISSNPGGLIFFSPSATSLVSSPYRNQSGPFKVEIRTGLVVFKIPHRFPVVPGVSCKFQTSAMQTTPVSVSEK